MMEWLVLEHRGWPSMNDDFKIFSNYDPGLLFVHRIIVIIVVIQSFYIFLSVSVPNSP